MALRNLVILLILATVTLGALGFKKHKKIVAKCVIKNDKVEGEILLEEKHKKGPLIISGQVHGLEPGHHGMHVHKYGDISGKHCEKTGPHFNPHKKKHGGKNDKKGHLGDMGNIKADHKGIAYIYLEDHFMTFRGKHSILGRSIKIHEKKDDLGHGGDEGSKISGNSGDGVACCIIGEIKG